MKIKKALQASSTAPILSRRRSFYVQNNKKTACYYSRYRI